MGPISKKRKVRKGTHSCWECRRRKVGCKFAPNNDAICLNCQERETSCISQDHDPQEQTPPPPSIETAPDDVLARRLGRLEEMMGKISKNDPPAQHTSDYTYHKDTQLDLLDESAVKNAHEVTGGAGLLTPETSARSPADPISAASSSRATRYREISRKLHALLPSKELRKVLAYESPGAFIALNGFHNNDDILAGKTEATSALADDSYPAVTCHPTILAKRLLQYTICLQFLPQSRLATVDLGGLIPCQAMSSWVSAASDLVTSVDDLVGSLEGLECLILQAWFNGDAGHLRKAWMASRRALGMAQLMGLGRSNTAVRSVTSRAPANHHVLWYKINCSDRYHSLVLGLPPGSMNNSFAHQRFSEGDSFFDKMNKQYAVLAGRISERQETYELNSQESYAVTQSIDADMETLSMTVPESWWLIPDINATTAKAPEDLVLEQSVIRLQVRHYTLMILLHLPFIVRENESQLRRYEYNRKTCLHAARCLLQRFLAFRKDYIIYVAGRHVDYAALIAAMTLCLGYLGTATGADRQSDATLVEETLAKFKLLAAQKGDRLSQEGVETIQQMLRILKGEMGQGGLALAVPFLGTVNIEPKAPVQQSDSSLSNTHPVEDIYMDSDPTLSENFAANLGEDLNFNSAPLSLSFDTRVPAHEDQFPGTITGQSNGDISWTPPNWVDFAFEPDDWALQGVDTSFWSMLNQSMN